MTTKINDQVRLKSSSPYYQSQGANGIGIITELINSEGIQLYRVTFQNGSSYTYLEEDLVSSDEKIEPNKFVIPTIGCDPELEVFDNYGVIAANTFLSGTGNQVGVDGNSSIAEVRPTYTDNAIKLTKNIEDTLKKLKCSCDKHFVGKDYIIRVGNGKRYSLGGHIHLGIFNKQPKVCEVFDIIAVGLSPIYQQEFFMFRQKSSYGKLGDIRGQPWGVEYRTLPSFILNKELTSGILCTFHSVGIDIMNNKIDSNKYYKRLSKWFSNYKTSIKRAYESGETDKFKFKLKTIKKMVMNTYGYKEMKGYRENIDRLFSMVENKDIFDESKNVIDEWGIKEYYSKLRIKLFNFSEDDFMEDIKPKKNGFTVNSRHSDLYNLFPFRVLGLKKSRNIDITTNENKMYEILKDYIKANKKIWSLKLDKVTDHGGSEIGLGHSVRESQKADLNKMFECIYNKLKEDRKK